MWDREQEDGTGAVHAAISAVSRVYSSCPWSHLYVPGTVVGIGDAGISSHPSIFGVLRKSRFVSGHIPLPGHY